MPSVPENPSADPVPLTVWTTRAGDGEHLPGDILRRILDTYSRPGELVITTTDILTGIADMCTATGRRHRTVNTSSDTDIPGWILTSRYPSTAALVLTSPPTEAAHRDDLAVFYRNLAALLRPGGILLVLIPDISIVGPDPLTDTISAARSAGLAYTQHLLAIHIPLAGGILTTPTDAYWDPADEPTIPTPLPPLRIHTDLAVFTRPASRSSL